MMLGSELLDVTDASGLIIPVRVDHDGGRGTRPPYTDGLNVKYFRTAIALLLARTQHRPGGILYLPPGRYLIENDLPEAWAANLWDRQLLGTYQPILHAARDANPFGASLRFPAELTLWLAPGAVLVPDRDAIVHIESALVCDPIQVFDLSLGGLVVFGTRVPRLLPQWWGIYPSEDHAPVIQAALDAGIYDRSNRWEYPKSTGGEHPVTENALFSKVFPPIPVELRGDYRLGRTIEVRTDAQRNQVTDILGDRALRMIAPGVSRVNGDDSIKRLAPDTLIEGTWSGRASCGARLAADRPFLGETLLSLPNAFGLTVRNIAFEAGESPAPSCLDLVPGNPSAPLQGVAVRGCTFSGGDTTLVRLGPPPAIIAPADVLMDQPPIAVDSNYSSDISGVAFDECEFRPRSGGVGLMVRTSQSVPFRLRGCAFVGAARTMISAWEGTFLLDGCYFENSLVVRPAPSVPGFEEPDGADIYLRFEPPSQGPMEERHPALYLTDTLPGFTATGCVSRSSRFLSTPSPTPRILQRLEWPILLLNVRHLPPAQSGDGIAVQWGMTNHSSGSTLTVGKRPSSRLFRGAALVILGGQYRGSLRVLPGAVQSVVVGARSVDGGLMPIDITTPRMGYGAPYPYTDVFGLDADPRE